MALPFVTPGKQHVGGLYGNLGFDFQTRDRLSLFAKVDGMVMSDESWLVVARSGVKVEF